MPRSLIMFVAIPIVGRLYNKISPRVVVGFGVGLFAITAWQMSHYTLATSPGDLWPALVLQGIALSCLWVPLTTVALASIPRHRMADATGLNSLIRQIGGSMGLAAFATLISRYAVQAKAGLAAHVAAGVPAVEQRLGLLSQAMMHAGMDPASARHSALQALYGQVTQQALVLTFEKLFLLAGILFLLVLPLLLLLKAPSVDGPVPKADVHIEM